MEENQIFQEQSTEMTVTDDGKKALDVASLVLGIITVAAAAFIPLVSYVCGIIGLVFAIKRRKERRTTAALVLCVLGLTGAVISNVIAAKILVEQLETMFG